MKNIAIFGSSGSIGSALSKELAMNEENIVDAFSRSQMVFHELNINQIEIDVTNETSIINALSTLNKNIEYDMVIVATGALHLTGILPEKSLRHLSLEKFEKIFKINTIAPALIMKHFIPKLRKNTRTVFGCLSARVGSISDNKLGGWYSYRASKAALNMIIKTASIESSRNRPLSIVVGLHPGTVDSNLSKPFQQNVSTIGLLTKETSAKKLIDVLNGLDYSDTGKCIDFNGLEVLP